MKLLADVSGAGQVIGTPNSRRYEVKCENSSYADLAEQLRVAIQNLQ